VVGDYQTTPSTGHISGCATGETHGLVTEFTPAVALSIVKRRLAFSNFSKKSAVYETVWDNIVEVAALEGAGVEEVMIL
jgi:hypothetical protein